LERLLIENGFAEITPHENAGAHKLFVRNAKFFDDEIVIKCVNVLVVDDSTYHACASEHQHVGIGRVDSIDLFVAQELDACNFGFSRATNVWNTENLAE